MRQFTLRLASLILIFAGTCFGQLSPKFSEFALPKGSAAVYLAAGPDRNIWFTDNSGAIGRIDSQGNVKEFALPSTGLPSGITAGPDGNLWFTDSMNAQVGRLTTSGSFTVFNVPSRSAVKGIITGGDGNLWFVEYPTQRIGRATPQGEIMEFPIAGLLGGIFSLAYGPDGNIWFTDGGGQIGKMTPSGAVTFFALPNPIGPPYGVLPDGIAAGPDGNLWFTERYGGEIGRITTTGVVTLFSEAGSPTWIVSRADGLWFVDDADNVGVTTVTGGITEFPIPTQGSSPTSVAIAPDGTIWFVEFATRKIGRLSGAAPNPSAPAISLVANAFGESPLIAGNMWVEVKGENLAPPGDSRIWQASDFLNGLMPVDLDGVSVTVNGGNAFVYFISANQINILTPASCCPSAGPVEVQVITGASQSGVVVARGGISGVPYTVQAQSAAPSLFVYNGGPYVIAVHGDGTRIGPAGLFPGLTTPAKPGETIVLFANGFGSTNSPIQNGAATQSGNLPVLPTITIGGVNANVQFAGLISPGLFQLNVVVPSFAPNGDLAIAASYDGVGTQAGTLITVQQ